MDDAVAIKNSDIASELCLPPVKSVFPFSKLPNPATPPKDFADNLVHCSMLAEDAIKAAVKNFQEKQEQKNLVEAEVASA